MYFNVGLTNFLIVLIFQKISHGGLCLLFFTFTTLCMFQSFQLSFEI